MKRSHLIALAVVAVPAIGLPLVSTQAQTTSPATTQNAKPYTPPKNVGGNWTIDPAHSRIGFAVRHLMINDVHGSFNDFEGAFVVDEKDYTKSSVDFKAKVASIDTNIAPRDTHLRSADFFDAEKYPEITFKSTRIERDGDGFRAVGTFTMKGVSKTITIPFRITGPITDNRNTTRAGVQANLEINRQDYGITYGQVIENVGLSIDNIVKIDLDLEAIKK